MRVETDTSYTCHDEIETIPCEQSISKAVLTDSLLYAPTNIRELGRSFASNARFKIFRRYDRDRPRATKRADDYSVCVKITIVPHSRCNWRRGALNVPTSGNSEAAAITRNRGARLLVEEETNNKCEEMKGPVKKGGTR